MDNEAYDDGKTIPISPHSDGGSTSGYQPPPVHGYYCPNQQPDNHYTPRLTPRGQPNQQVVAMRANPMSGWHPLFITQTGPQVSLIGALVTSFLVSLVFCFICGGIAFILAITGQSWVSSGHLEGAMRMRNASYGVSIAGIFVGIVIYGVVIFTYVSKGWTVVLCNYYFCPNCY